MNLTEFKPQLVSTGDANSFIFKNDVVAIEPKIDGIRIILVKKGNEIRLFSRLMRDWTEHFQSVIEKLKEGISFENCVLDGEMAVMKNNKFTSSNSVMRNKLESDEKYVYFVFDILEAGKTNVMDCDLITRKQNISLGVTPNGSITIVPFTMINNTEDLMDIYKKILDKGGEGIVLKNLKPYSQDERYNWLKKKPFETLDLEIISKKLRKDNKGWIYGLSDNKIKVGSTWTPDNLEVGQIVEVKYEKRYERNNKSYSLRFPKIVRLREDKE